MGETLYQFDICLLQLGNLELTGFFLDSLFGFLTNKKHFALAALLGGACGLLYADRRRFLAALLALVLSLAVASVSVERGLWPVFDRERPFRRHQWVVLRTGKHTDQRPSMPSAHATNAFALATVLATLLGKRWWWLYLVAAAVAYSRVYLGVHYPSDLAAGALWGAGIGWSVVFLLRWWWPGWYGKERWRAPPEGSGRPTAETEGNEASWRRRFFWAFATWTFLRLWYAADSGLSFSPDEARVAGVVFAPLWGLGEPGFGLSWLVELGAWLSGGAADYYRRLTMAVLSSGALLALWSYVRAGWGARRAFWAAMLALLVPGVAGGTLLAAPVSGGMTFAFLALLLAVRAAKSPEGLLRQAQWGAAGLFLLACASCQVDLAACALVVVLRCWLDTLLSSPEARPLWHRLVFLLLALLGAVFVLWETLSREQAAALGDPLSMSLVWFTPLWPVAVGWALWRGARGDPATRTWRLACAAGVILTAMDLILRRDPTGGMALAATCALGRWAGEAPAEAGCARKTLAGVLASVGGLTLAYLGCLPAWYGTRLALPAEHDPTLALRGWDRAISRAKTLAPPEGAVLVTSDPVGQALLRLERLRRQEASPAWPSVSVVIAPAGPGATWANWPAHPERSPEAMIRIRSGGAEIRRFLLYVLGP